MIIRDILSMKGGTIFSMPPDGKVSAAVGTMVKNDIGSLVVMEGGRMTGMVTFREVLKALDAQGGSCHSTAQPLGQSGLRIEDARLARDRKRTAQHGGSRSRIARGLGVGARRSPGR